MQAALELVAAAEAAAQVASASAAEPFVWRQPIVRLAASVKQVVHLLLPCSC